MKPVFIQLQCVPGKTYEVADQLYAREIVSELYSTSGEYDLLLKRISANSLMIMCSILQGLSVPLQR